MDENTGATLNYKKPVCNISVGPSIFPFHTCIRQWKEELCSRTNREAYKAP